jgi:5-formaminoimidazole-4-carboxamide-1-beta-D-ribofuranosyl 5'-monophosphate synthetase
MSTREVRLFVPKGCFTAYVSGMTVVDEIFCPPLYVEELLMPRKKRRHLLKEA